MGLRVDIKDKATTAFRNNVKLAEMTAEEREIAAAFYEGVAANVKGIRIELARRYNIERARFLRGEVSRIVDPATAFAAEIGESEE